MRSAFHTVGVGDIVCSHSVLVKPACLGIGAVIGLGMISSHGGILWNFCRIGSCFCKVLCVIFGLGCWFFDSIRILWPYQDSGQGVVLWSRSLWISLFYWYLQLLIHWQVT